MAPEHSDTSREGFIIRDFAGLTHIFEIRDLDLQLKKQRTV